MANQVVRAAAQPALLLRERLEHQALGALPAGGLRLRPRALPQARALGQGAARETGEAAPGLGAFRRRQDPNFGPWTQRPPVAQSGQGQRAGVRVRLPSTRHFGGRQDRGRRGGEARGRGPGPDSQEECEPASSPKWCSPPPLPPLRPGAPDHLPRPGGAAPARWRGRERWLHGARVPASPQPGAGAPSRALPSSGCRPQGPAGRHRAVMVSQQHTEGSQAPR